MEVRLRPDIPPEPLTALPALLRRAGMTGRQMAVQLGVSPMTVNSWARQGIDPPSRCLREMALILGCGVNDILNGRTPPSRLKDWLERWEAEEPLETVAQLSFPSASYDFPLSARARAELLYALASRGRVPWVGFDTTDRRLVFFNAGELESISIVPASSNSQQATRDNILVETTAGKHLSLLPSDELVDVVELLLRITEHPDSVIEAEQMNDWLVRLSANGPTTTVDYRLGALLLFDVPLEPYRAALERVVEGDYATSDGIKAGSS